MRTLWGKTWKTKKEAQSINKTYFHGEAKIKKLKSGGYALVSPPKWV